MQLRPLGSTNLFVSPIGLGLAALGRPGYINIGHAEDLEENYDVDVMQTRAHRVLDAAHRAGIVYFDVARSYGRSEMFLNSWLTSRSIRPETLVIGSKWGYRYTADWQVHAEFHEIKEHSIDRLQSQWRESQSMLGAHLDLYQIHSATLESGVLQNTAVFQELAHLKEQGIAIGLTTSGPQQGQVIYSALELKVDGLSLFDCVQSTWNLLERSAGEALQSAHEAGLGVIVKEALANGRLTDRNNHASPNNPIERLETEAQRLKTSIDALALAAVLANPWVHVVLSGAARPEHLQSNLNALKTTFDEEAEQNLSGLVEEPGTYWALRSELSWN